jgi:hypothetical protein
MRNLTFAAALAVLIAVFAGPAQAQQQQMTIQGDEAVKIVQSGKIRASKSDGIPGFLLLIEYQGKSYMCTVAARGQVQTCDQLYW